METIELTVDRLAGIVENDAAIRRVQKLRPAGGPSDKVFPATYPGDDGKKGPRYAFEERWIADGNGGGQKTRCVLLDSVQSQANRLEESLLFTMRAGRLLVPYIAVDFGGQRKGVRIDGEGKEAKVSFGDGDSFTAFDLSDLGEITSLDAPHRVFDAIIRDSQMPDGTVFTKTDRYKELVMAKPTNAFKLFGLSPTSLLFGAWNSTGEGGGLGSKFARCIVSEIVGVGAVDGIKGAVRVDPLGIKRDAMVVGKPLDWKVSRDAKEKGRIRPSEINHSNIIGGLSSSGGVTVEHALHTAVISCAGLRRLGFPGTKDETAGRTVLAALGLVALTQQDGRGYCLRSRCDLVRDGSAPFEVVHPDGSTGQLDGLDAARALRLLEEAVTKAREAGFSWPEKPLQLKPQPRLVELVVLSRAKALAGEGEAEGGAEDKPTA